tara:strand:- start:1797 stop:2315 length:519 start_codon:yes stop_codon:yes gene_type:complete
METTLNKNSIDLGVKLGTFLFIITAIIYVVDLNYFSNFLLMLAVYRIPVIAFGIYAVISNKKLKNGIITFKEAFTSYFLCIVIGYLIVNLGTIVLFKFIDPAAAGIINENAMVAVKEMMENYDSPSELIAATMDEMQNNDAFSFSSIIAEFFSRLLLNAIFAVPVALIFKKS